MSGPTGSNKACVRCLTRLPANHTLFIQLSTGSRYDVCRSCWERLSPETQRAWQAKMPKPLDTQPYASQAGGDTLKPAPDRETAMYLSREQCVAYVARWLAHVAAQPHAQPRHYMRLKALPRPSEGERK